MIVKLIIHTRMDAISVWNQNGDRLFYSDQPKDIETAKELLKVKKGLSDKEIGLQTLGQHIEPVFEQRMHGYFNAYWRNKIVQVCKRAEGYNW